MRRSLFALLLCCLPAACRQEQPFDRPIVLGGRQIAPKTLNQGRVEYEQSCRPCHGEKGDGHGPASYALRPPPRDFTQGLFKFGHVPAPALPPDEELRALVRGGLHGTAMRPWDGLPDEKLDAVLQYIKTFSPRWQSERPGPPVEVSRDPFGPARAEEATSLGRRIYHVKARCSSCHPAFITHEELYKLSRATTTMGQREFAPNMYRAELKVSEYCRRWRPGWKKFDERECAEPVKVLPPDFTRDPLRTIGETKPVVDLYRIIASGIGGANMPTWKGALPEEELWALAYYVDSLRRMRGTSAAEALQRRLLDPKNLAWQAPPARF
jgi:mono/diheme cytochrome c family protein